MNVIPSEIPHSELYGILLNSVAPRPIAWVSTLSAAGQPNLAPFSFFNAMCIDPPLLGFAPGLRQPKRADASHGEPKDTLRNVRETKEFVVNVVTYELLQQMNVTSGEYDPSVNEFEFVEGHPGAFQARTTGSGGGIPSQFRVQTASDYRLLSRPHEQQPGDRRDCLHSHGGRAH
jgi:flavin reductase (DIM6/NTAB) family NADH-FMN oxidoreductase RutF